MVGAIGTRPFVNFVTAFAGQFQGIQVKIVFHVWVDIEATMFVFVR